MIVGAMGKKGGRGGRERERGGGIERERER